MQNFSLWALLPPAFSIFTAGGLWAVCWAPLSGSVIGFLRYLQLKNRLCRPWLNVAGLAFFSIACFGMTIVGNFQVNIHDSGTLMTFGMGTLYCWLQAYITLRVNLKGEGTKVAALRFLLAGLITLCLILKFAQRLNAAAAQCQWALVMSFLIYVGTFGIDFRHSHFDAVCTDEAEHPEESRTSMIEQELQQL
uniref:Transmembrane protein 150C n=1 Tax=Oryzias latipes TaxID=8090 RepID=A0A3B3H8F5_ORYLA